MTKRDAQQLGKGLAFLSPWIVGFCAFMLLPIVLSFYYSLCEYSGLQKPMYIGTGNYEQLLGHPGKRLFAWLTGNLDSLSPSDAGDPIFWLSVKNSLYYAAMVIPSSLLLSLGMAMLLNTPIPGQSIFRTIIFLPSLVPIVASAMVWMWLYNGKYGLINHMLAKIGINGPAWLNDENWALPAIAIMSLWGVGHSVVIYLAGLQDVPRELYEAAEIDGAGIWGRLWHVTLPFLSPVIFFNLIMAIISVLQVFDLPFIMTPNGGPSRSTELVAVYLFDNAFRFAQLGYASSIAWIMLVMILILTGLAFWSSKRWVHYQGK